MIEISIKNQKLKVVKDSKVVEEYQISTSKKGVGCEYGSEKTPIGRHRICEKIGDGLSIGNIFEKRESIGILSRIYKSREEYPYKEEAPCMTTRILRLEGLESGINRDDNVDTFKRCVYIHGTPYEYAIGVPSSKGCIRMRNRDIVELFDLVEEGDEVSIVEERE